MILVLSTMMSYVFNTGVCKVYERYLKDTHPPKSVITYDIPQLFDFIDGIPDLACLVYQPNTKLYKPYNKEWIKEKVYNFLRKKAAKK